MKYIKKKASPKLFEDWKAFKKPTIWKELDGMPLPDDKRLEDIVYYSKHELRAALLEEQHSICCYCECRIENHPLKTNIEHLEPREGDTKTERIFDYANLLASCNGGERDPKPKKIHCDHKKGNKPIPLTPLDRRCEIEILFSIEGNIIGKTNDAQETIKILNLDIDKLNNQRSQAIAAYIYQDQEATEFVSPEEGEKIYQAIEKQLDEPYQSAILDALRQIS
ncbi:MAG: retron system putative HNH endonuclease [Bacteroidota bacterium]